MKQILLILLVLVALVFVGGMLLQSGPVAMTLLCEVLAALGNMKRGVLKLLLPDICNTILALCENDYDVDVPAELKERKVKNLVLLTTILFQTLKGHQYSSEAEAALAETLRHVDSWSAYRIGRNACRYGHFEQASRIFAMNLGKVSSESLYYWLSGKPYYFTGLIF